MDISRPDIKRKKIRRQIVVGAIGLVVVAAAAAAVYRLKPARPRVDASTVWPDTVKRGPMVVQVRGLGTLVPSEESIRLIPSQTEATVTRIRVLPGTKVTPDTVLMDLDRSAARPGTADCPATAEIRPGGLSQPADDPAERPDGQKGVGGNCELRLQPGAIAGADGQTALRPGCDQWPGL